MNTILNRKLSPQDKLFDRITLDDAIVITQQSPEQDWKKKAMRQLSARLEDKAFPCLFGRKAWKDQSAHFAFCDVADNDYSEFLKGLVNYTNFVKSTAMEDRLLSPLIVFFNSNGHSLHQHELGWRALNWVHRRDPKAWPAQVPAEPDNAEWTFCFNDVSLFVNMSSSNHKILQSRNLGDYLTFIINPRENFDAVASSETKSGRKVREQIRNRVAHYNNGYVPSELGFFGDQDNLEWKQYQLAEEGLEQPKSCPFKPK